jgi:hypothetical protein
MYDTDIRMKKVRQIIKAHAPKVSVRAGRGTVRDWLHITGSGGKGNFTKDDYAGLRKVGIYSTGTPDIGLDREAQKKILRENYIE